MATQHLNAYLNGIYAAKKLPALKAGRESIIATKEEMRLRHSYELNPISQSLETSDRLICQASEAVGAGNAVEGILVAACTDSALIESHQQALAGVEPIAIKRRGFYHSLVKIQSERRDAEQQLASAPGDVALTAVVNDLSTQEATVKAQLDEAMAAENAAKARIKDARHAMCLSGGEKNVIT